MANAFITSSGQAYRPSKSRQAIPKKRIFNHEMYELAFGTIYAGLMTNFLLLVTCLPLIVLLFTTDPAESWPGLVLGGLLAMPALVAAFAVFAEFSTGEGTQVVRTFFRSWWRFLRRSLAVGALLFAVLVIAGLNTRFFLSQPALGAAVIPLQLTMMLLATLTALVALVAIPDLPGARLRGLLLTSLLLAVRKWYLTLPSLGVLLLLGNVVVQRPAIGLGFAVAPMLYVVWGTTRFALRPVLANDGVAERSDSLKPSKFSLFTSALKETSQ